MQKGKQIRIRYWIARRRDIRGSKGLFVLWSVSDYCLSNPAIMRQNVGEEIVESAYLNRRITIRASHLYLRRASRQLHLRLLALAALLCSLFALLRRMVCGIDAWAEWFWHGQEALPPEM